MNMFGLEGSGFIIAISVCLLLVGAVVYYFNARVATLEKGLTAQSGILQTFIANVKHQLMNTPPPPVSGGGNVVNAQQEVVENNGATPAAMDAAQEWSNGKPRSLVPVSDDDNSDEDDDDDSGEEDDDSLEDSEDGEEDSEDEDDVTDDEDDNKLINVSDDITDVNLEGLLNVAPITVMKVEDGNIPAVAMVMQALELEEREVVDLTSQDEGPKITEIVDVTDSKEAGTDDAVNEISLGELENMESLDNTIDESGKSSSLGSSLSGEDDNDGATADTNISLPAGTDFSKMNVPTLKRLAKDAKITGYSSMKKAALIAALEKHLNQ